MDAVPFLVALLLPVVVAAQTYKVGGCPVLQPHQPAADVEYKAGLDVHGWAVPPADLNEPALGADDFDPVRIDLNIPIANYLDEERYQLDSSRAELSLGQIEVDGDAATRFNGQYIGGSEIVTHPDCD